MTRLAPAAVVLAIASTGCGAMFNGFAQTVEVRADDPEAEIIANGTVVGKGKAEITGMATDPPSVFVRARGGSTLPGDGQETARSTTTVVATAERVIAAAAVIPPAGDPQRPAAARAAPPTATGSPAARA